MHGRLMHRLERVRRHWEAIRGNRPAPGPHEWRHGAEPAHRPGHFPRPASERQVVRHKTFALTEEGVDEAAFDMEALDYDFHLFTDVETGQAGGGLSGHGQLRVPRTPKARNWVTSLGSKLSSDPITRVHSPDRRRGPHDMPSRFWTGARNEPKS